MKPKTTPPVLFNAEEVYNFFFYEHDCVTNNTLENIRFKPFKFLLILLI